MELVTVVDDVHNEGHQHEVQYRVQTVINNMAKEGGIVIRRMPKDSEKPESRALEIA